MNSATAFNIYVIAYGGAHIFPTTNNYLKKCLRTLHPFLNRANQRLDPYLKKRVNISNARSRHCLTIEFTSPTTCVV